MSDKTYEKLRELIDVHPLGCPPAPEVLSYEKIDELIDQAKVVGIAR